MNLQEALTQHAEHLKRLGQDQARAYDEDGAVPLTGYVGSLTVYGLVTAGLVATGRATGRSLPEHYRLGDLLMGGLATHKFTRLLGKASVTSPLRVAFTEFQEPAGSAELNERPRGHGVRHTIGELVTCPFCLGQWVGTGYVAGLALTPRVAKTWAAVFTVTAISDLLQHFYARLRTG